jgi:hypothetical protein
MSLKDDLFEFLSNYEKKRKAPVTVDLNETYPCTAICVDRCCIGFIVFADGKRIYGARNLSLKRGNHDKNRGFVLDKNERLVFDRRNAVETKLPEDFAGLNEFENLLVMEVKSINKNDKFDTWQGPGVRMKFVVPIAYRENDKIFAAKLSFYQATVTRAQYSNGSHFWFPQVFGEMWDFGSWCNPFASYESVTMNKSPRGRMFPIGEIFSSQDEASEKVMRDPGKLSDPLLELAVTDNPYIGVAPEEEQAGDDSEVLSEPVEPCVGAKRKSNIIQEEDC